MYPSKQIKGTTGSSLLLVARFISFSLKLNLMQTTRFPVQSTRNVNFYIPSLFSDLFILGCRCDSLLLLLFPPICQNQTSMRSELEVYCVFSPNFRCLQCDLLFYIHLKTGKIIPEQAVVIRLIQPSIAQHSLSPHVQRLFLRWGLLSEKNHLPILELKFSYFSVPMNASQFSSNMSLLIYSHLFHSTNN